MLIHHTNTTQLLLKKFQLKQILIDVKSANGASSPKPSRSMPGSSPRRPPPVWMWDTPNIRWCLSRVQRRIMRILGPLANFHRLHTTSKDTGRTKRGPRHNTTFLDRPHARSGNFLMEARPLIFSKVLLQVMIIITAHHLTNMLVREARRPQTWVVRDTWVCGYN